MDKNMKTNQNNSNMNETLKTLTQYHLPIYLNETKAEIEEHIASVKAFILCFLGLLTVTGCCLLSQCLMKYSRAS
jgi:hypothetical protein